MENKMTRKTPDEMLNEELNLPPQPFGKMVVEYLYVLGFGLTVFTFLCLAMYIVGPIN
jgi:hypothetical protein